MKKFMGRHLIVDAYGVKGKILDNKKILTKILDDLPAKLEMRILRKPIVSTIKSDKYPHTGYSGFVILYESHISFHTWPEENFIAIDIYSCRDFDDKDAVQYLKKFLDTKSLKMKSIIRG